MDAWEILVDNSTLVTGDAWEHLNAQEGGGDVVIDGLVLVGDVQLEVLSTKYIGFTDSLSYEVLTKSDSIVLEIEEPTLEVEK